MAFKPDYIKIEIISKDCDSSFISSNFTIEDKRLILHGEGFPILDRASTVKAVGQSKDGIVLMEGFVTLSIEKQMNINITHFGEKKDRREYLKVRTDIKARVQRSFMGENKRGLIVDKQIQLRDISLGGISFFSNQIFFVNQKLYICLKELHEGLVVKALVLRKEKEGTFSDFRYRYACKFLGLDNLGQRVICEHVFKMEIENYRREEEKDKKIYD